MLKKKGLLDWFWGEAVITVVYLLNRGTVQGSEWHDAVRGLAWQVAGGALAGNLRLHRLCA
jgi:hypothetical protein